MKSILPYILTALSVLFLSACGPKQVSLDPNKQSEEQLYNYAVAQLKEGNFAIAREAFKVVFDNFPKSDYRILAKVGIADGYFQEGGDSNYLLAIQEYQDFISLFPFSPKAEYAQLMIGHAYGRLMEKPDRDQTYTKKALEEYRKVVENYPNGPHFQEAQNQVLACYSRLAEHEYLIGRYYQRSGRTRAAIDRYKSILKTYPENVYQPHYYFHLAEALDKMNEQTESCTFYDTLLKKWPDSEFSEKARERQTAQCNTTAPATPETPAGN